MADSSAAKRAVVVLVGVAVALGVAWPLFVEVPGGNLATLLGIVLALLAAVAGARIASRVAASRFADYDVAEVAVEGPITRDGGGGRLPTTPGGASADDIVEQIDRADEDPAAEALLLKLNTPGGQVVPSDDIRVAAERFDGPTVAYATDVCASGGYWIASGCDAIFARDGSIVGSIGVIGSRVNAAELADKVGLEYERLAAGEYKDAGAPFKEMSESEREYLQGIIDGYYEEFVERVTDGRELDDEQVRDTEARVYLGGDALSIGLVDELGTRRDVKERLAAELGEDEVEVREFEPERALMERFRRGSATLAYSFGAGVASAFAGDDGGVEGVEFELR
ncbi:signal peptide peptidase SppA [Halorussus salilacus]|uniref:signal peptide peptidase SppA n=1 Tax=Halorussus salilacus TaxID=2953750 RepID=UPI0020A029E6|nr:signal peptide peptidase SppA [Halorussus salilacus]USZ69131.1 signal peptide peptidase SppA [Halorussus salilacus]